MNAKKWMASISITMLLLGAWRGIRISSAEGDLGVGQLPWRTEYLRQDIDTSSVAAGFDAYTRKPLVTYYDESNDLFRQAAYVGIGSGSCGLYNAWECTDILANNDVGEYHDVENYQDSDLGLYRTGYIYYDGRSTENSLRYYNVFSLGSGGGSYGQKIMDFDQIIGSQIGSRPQLVFDQDGNAHVVVVIETETDDLLLYAHQVLSGGSCLNYGGTAVWQCDVIVSGTDAVDDPSIALNTDGTARIAYYVPVTRALGYAYPNSSNQNCGPDNQWRCITIEDLGTVGKFPSMAISSSEYIAYYDASQGALRLAHYVGSAGNCGEDYVDGSLDYRWQCESIDQIGYDLMRTGIKLALVDGYPVMAYMDDNDSAQSVLKLAQPAQHLGLAAGNCGPQDPAYTWVCELVDQGAYNLAGELDMAVDPSGKVHIGYLEADTSALQSHLWVAWQGFFGCLPLVTK